MVGGIPVPKCDGITEVTMQIFYDLDAYKWINGLSQQEIWVMQMCGTSRCIEPTVPAAKDESFWRKKCRSLPACVSGCVVFVEKCHIQTKILGTVSGEKSVPFCQCVRHQKSASKCVAWMKRMGGEEKGRGSLNLSCSNFPFVCFSVSNTPGFLDG